MTGAEVRNVEEKTLELIRKNIQAAKRVGQRLMKMGFNIVGTRT
jgi:hypothetical protein